MALRLTERCCGCCDGSRDGDFGDLAGVADLLLLDAVGSWQLRLTRQF